MDAHPLNTPLAFPDLARRALDEYEIASSTLDFPPADEEPLGVFHGLVAAAMIQVGFLLLVGLGWQIWRFLR
ncbi:MAG TPA: hypothetical protein VHX13_02955 [Acidobacteriaceae bacterium]|jgi:hypothetical protein|nr:hypothetical protein [Acidobacteriaceae bacterium]